MSEFEHKAQELNKNPQLLSIGQVFALVITLAFAVYYNRNNFLTITHLALILFIVLSMFTFYWAYKCHSNKGQLFMITTQLEMKLQSQIRTREEVEEKLAAYENEWIPNFKAMQEQIAKMNSEAERKYKK
jgi:predicted membrane protein